MRPKPTTARPVIVCKIRHVYKGMCSAQWDDLLNYPRQLSDLFRQIDGVWHSGEAHPSGVYGSLLRPAPVAVGEALTAFAALPSRSHGEEIAAALFVAAMETAAKQGGKNGELTRAKQSPKASHR